MDTPEDEILSISKAFQIDDIDFNTKAYIRKHFGFCLALLIFFYLLALYAPIPLEYILAIQNYLGAPEETLLAGFYGGLILSMIGYYILHIPLENFASFTIYTKDEDVSPVVARTIIAMLAIVVGGAMGSLFALLCLNNTFIHINNALALFLLILAFFKVIIIPEYQSLSGDSAFYEKKYIRVREQYSPEATAGIILEHRKKSLSYWYLRPWGKFNVFTGRACSLEFWTFCVVNSLVFLVIMIISRYILAFDSYELIIIFGVLIAVPTIAVTIRRLHDTNRSGWWILLGVVPIVGWYMLAQFLIEDSYPDTNRFGRNPRDVPDYYYILP